MATTRSHHVFPNDRRRTPGARWSVPRHGMSLRRCVGSSAGPRLDVGAQPESTGPALEDRGREVGISAAVDADDIARCEAEQFGDVTSVDQIVEVYVSAHIATVVAEVQPAAILLKRHNRSGPGGAVTPRGPASTYVEVLTWQSIPRPRPGALPGSRLPPAFRALKAPSSSSSS